MYTLIKMYEKEIMKYPELISNFRMGSFTSVPLTRDDIQDLDIQVPAITTRETLLNRCIAELPKDPPLISRNFIRLADNAVIPPTQPQLEYANSSTTGNDFYSECLTCMFHQKPRCINNEMY